MSYWGGSDDEGGGANTQTNSDWKPEIYTQTATDDGGNGGNGGEGGGNGGPGEYKHETPWYMDSMKYGQKFSFGAPPGGGGGVSTGGKGGAGMVGALGDFQYDKFGYDAYGGPAMAAETYTADTYNANPLAQDYQYGDFTSPNEAVDFREFQAPTQEQAMADQGYQFRLAEGQRALENAAAAKGMLRTGNTWKDLMNYGQGAASQEYDKVYGRQMGEHNLAYQQALQANQDQYGRAAQGWQMNRQNQADMYGRALTDDQRRMQAQQLTNQSRTQAQQLSEQSRFGAHAANLGVHQANYGIASGVHDRNFQGANTAYNYAMQRAMHESQMAESAASRAQSASSANAARGERAYDKAYGRAMDEYLLGYDQFKDAEQEAWNRNKWGVELGVRTAGSDNQ